MERETYGWMVVVVLALMAIALVWTRGMENDKELQKDYNKSLVACVATGKDPASCKNALTRSN